MYVESFLAEINSKKQSSQKYAFRGHAKKNYSIEPSIFRESDEYGFYSHIYSQFPQEFSGMTPIEILAKMQHMDGCTRLLDLTENPLVGLFFSLDVINSKENNIVGDESEVVMIPINEYKDLYSDRVIILSHLPRLSKENREELHIACLNDLSIQLYLKKQTQSTQDSPESIDIKKKVVRYATAFFSMRYELDKLIYKTYQCMERALLGRNFIVNYNFGESNFTFNKANNSFRFDFTINDDVLTIYHNNSEIIEVKRIVKKNLTDSAITETLDGLCLLEIKKSEKYADFFIDPKNNVPSLLSTSLKPLLTEPDGSDYLYISAKRLFSEIRKTYSGFKPCTCPHDLLNGVFIKAPYRTERINRQQGVFALFGLSKYWNVFKAFEFLSDSLQDNTEILEVLYQNANVNSVHKKYNLQGKRLDDFVFGAQRIKSIIPQPNVDFLGQNLKCKINEFYPTALEQIEKLKDISDAHIDILRDVNLLRAELDNIGINTETMGCCINSSMYYLQKKIDNE